MKTQSNQKQRLGAISSLLWCYVIFFCFSVFVVRMKTNECRGNGNTFRRRQPLVSAATSGTSSVVDVTVARRLFTTGRHMHTALHNIGRHLLECGAKDGALPFKEATFAFSVTWQHQKWRVKGLFRGPRAPRLVQYRIVLFLIREILPPKSLFPSFFIYIVALRATAARR